jgi:hypothetical protein
LTYYICHIQQKSLKKDDQVWFDPSGGLMS